MLSIEQLLRPRFKVIADYPRSTDMVGSIVTPVNAGDPLFAAYYEQYPAIFQRLQWWEDRAIEDLPEYLTMSGRTRKVWKVDRWEDTDRYGLLAYTDDERTPHYLDADKSVQYSPSTLTEYEAYKTK